MKKIVLASNNKHKLEEFASVLKGYEILSLNDISFNEEIVEDGETFLENSLIKAKTVSKYLVSEGMDYDVLADDSGLCVIALDLKPGIYSARYSGEHGNDKANRDKLIKDLEKFQDKSAYFNATLVLYHTDGTYQSFVGKTYGEIIDTERGDNGFGYDPIFLSKDLGKTFGEASNLEKNSVSHRGRAVEELLKELNK